MKDGFFLNLLSHLCSADVATLLPMVIGTSFCSLCILVNLPAGRDARAQRVTKNFSLTIRITGVEECDARDDENSDGDDNIKNYKRV